VSSLDGGWTGRLDQAAEVVSRRLAPTPLVPTSIVGVDAPVYLKLESLQPTGSFKVRGGLAAAAAYGRHGLGIVTASAGNHGLGVAYAASALSLPATVFVPVNASSAKVEALRRFPIDLRLQGGSYDEAEAAAQRFASSTGARFVSAYSDPHVIAGQATVVREVAALLSGPFRIVVPVGGGGLAAGTALGAPRGASVMGVETARSRAVSSSMEAGRIVEVLVGDTIADGLAGNIAAETITPRILREYGVTMLSVQESSIRSAVRSLALEHGVVSEGSGAVGLAAAREGLIPADLPVVLVITGRNIAAAALASLVAA
jgi:threonine dehydratase